MPRNREYLAELAGTFLMLLIGLSAVTVMFAASSPVLRWVPSEGVRRLITGTVFAGGATLIVDSPIGKTSGGHLNPAVTLAMLRMGKMTPRGAAGYVAAQLAGALAGAAAVRLLWGSLAADVRVGATVPGIGGWPGTSLNPARSLGPAVVTGILEDLWIYLLAPLTGALLAVLVYRRKRLGVRCGKLVHDDRYECRFLDCRYTPPSRRLPSKQELDVAGRVAHECARRDILALVNLVAADERIARYRHPLPTYARIERTLLVALTGRRHGLHASLTRMVSFGRPDGELASRHDAVTRIDARLLLESRPGVSLAEVFAHGRDQYAHEGHTDQWRLHHQGGLTGYAGREVFATPTASHRLGREQALAWNPSVTSVKSEDTVLVTDREPEVLTRTGDWPTRPVELPVGTIERPALLVEGAGT